MDELAANSGVPAQIASQLRSLIGRGTLGPGTRLGQTELADQFGASRVPVREALKLLTSEGIVEHDPNRGFFVARLSRDEAEQLFAMRHLIEDELLIRIAWPAAAQLDDLQRRTVRLEELLVAGDRAGWWNDHRGFHVALFNLSPSKIIVREALRLWMLTDRYRALLPMPGRSGTDHGLAHRGEIIDALRTADRKRLLALRRKRRQVFERLVLEILEEREG